MNKPVGRPLKYTPELADLICERLAGGESLRSICEDSDMPSVRSIYNWLDSDKEFLQQYARAREAQADTLFDGILEIVDERPGLTDMGATDSGAVADKRLRFDARRWIASKLAPKKYGDKTAMELTGADGGPVQVSDTERAAKIAAILAAAKIRKEADESDVADLI